MFSFFKRKKSIPKDGFTRNGDPYTIIDGKFIRYATRYTREYVHKMTLTNGDIMGNLLGLDLMMIIAWRKSYYEDIDPYNSLEEAKDIYAKLIDKIKPIIPKYIDIPSNDIIGRNLIFGILLAAREGKIGDQIFCSQYTKEDLHKNRDAEKFPFDEEDGIFMSVNE